ncbi:hypothetical protein DICSQDRAFT_172686 [Dichomitus squalens LYAD-421 SS1]|uniref:Fungal-type protein kinase domain-containing protein n=1 Tax=Dichomitus squalens (strain LYAD-421) TaxID=732165 RepID=R7SR99_DICSQ|nr:uncharacterized protein DICSQDRAFT_172686 [Dichomitus squalens LYAD-421 SS1]EJF58674.1 hypothetical protein DICSQDRAFT_172686 [Dichomitus squalens LYAD-421 SS1]
MAHYGVHAELLEFCDEFFPKPTPSCTTRPKPTLDGNPFAALRNAEKLLEKNVRAAFTAAVNVHGLAPGLKMAECGERPDPAAIDPERKKIDAAFYNVDDVPDDGRQRWADQILSVEFKRDDVSLDPFDDDEENISTPTLTRKAVRGQIISYAELIFAVQQRVALFTLVVLGTRVRFVRWDRSGTVVTRAFDYVQNWEVFCEILWRIGNCTMTQLGFDPSATRLYPGQAEYDLMDAAADNVEGDIDETERVLSGPELPNGHFKYVREMFKKSLVDGWPRYMLEVPAPVEAATTATTATPARHSDSYPKVDRPVRKFLVCKPEFRAKGMAGRGTRGYVALDCTTKRFVWLKDAWRANYKKVDQEGVMLGSLNSAEVPFVPTLLCHGDILQQTTATPDWWERKNPLRSPTSSTSTSSSATASSHTLVGPSTSGSLKRKHVEESAGATSASPQDIDGNYEENDWRTDCPLRLHMHYRLAVKEVAMPLSKFKRDRQLVGIIYDCLRAHESAVKRAKLLHRDISAGNILIYPTVVKSPGKYWLKWSGLLADWELSRAVHEPDTPRRPRQPERTGTWQFMSVALLSHGLKIVGVADELESFFHVLLYYAVRYLKVKDCDLPTIAGYLYAYFDLYGVDNGVYVCGDKKRQTITEGRLTVSVNKKLEFGSPLDTLFSQLLSCFRARYAVLAKEAEKPATSPLESETQAPSDDIGAILDEQMAFIYTNNLGKEKLPVVEAEPGLDHKTIALAEQLSEHGSLLRAFLQAYVSDGWHGARVEDNIPDWWAPPKQAVLAVADTSAASNKRRKVGPPPPDINVQKYLSCPQLPLYSPTYPPVTPKKPRAPETTWNRRND